MLQDLYLPRYHYSEKHFIVIHGSPDKIWPHIDQMDFSLPLVIRVLFALRRIPAELLNREIMDKNRFYRLDQQERREIIIGLIGQFWLPNDNLQKFLPNEFASLNPPGFAKASWNFLLTPVGQLETKLETETRIFCTDDIALKKFSRYWFLVRPFSGIIRKAILRALKRMVENEKF
jgi:hypothetical protein